MKILIGSYGEFASGIKSSLNMLLDHTEHIDVMDCYDGPDEFEKKIEKYFQGVSDTEQIVMISDLDLGWVNPIMYMYLERPDTFLIAGANLTLVLQLALQKEPLTELILEEILEDSRRAMRILKKETNNNNSKKSEKSSSTPHKVHG